MQYSNLHADLVLAKPKSQIFRSHEAFKSRLLGFRSLCSTLAVCMNLSPLRICSRNLLANVAGTMHCSTMIAARSQLHLVHKVLVVII